MSIKRFFPVLILLCSCTDLKPAESTYAGPDTCQRQLAVCAINVAVQKEVVKTLKETCNNPKESAKPKVK